MRLSGELHLVRRDMQTAASTDSPEFLEFKDKSSKFLRKALQLLLSLISESGRDRFCYVKEALIHPDATCPRPAPLTSCSFSKRLLTWWHLAYASQLL